MTQPLLRRELRDVELSLIDDPLMPARETMDDEKFAALVSSIRAIGIIQAIVVKPVGARYEVIAGHRRRLASLAADLTTVPCMVVHAIDEHAEALKLHENTKREDLNPAEEALWFARMLETLAGGDTTTLADLVGESRQYVESRLVLLRHDEQIFTALKGGQINFAVATELNRVVDVGARRSYLEAAISGGATARLVREWRLAYERLVGARQELDGSAGDHLGGVAQPIGSTLCCLFCSSSADPHAMVLVYMHTHCQQIFERTTGVELRGVFAPREAAPAATPASGGQS